VIMMITILKLASLRLLSIPVRVDSLVLDQTTAVMITVGTIIAGTITAEMTTVNPTVVVMTLAEIIHLIFELVRIVIIVDLEDMKLKTVSRLPATCAANVGPRSIRLDVIPVRLALISVLTVSIVVDLVLATAFLATDPKIEVLIITISMIVGAQILLIAVNQLTYPLQIVLVPLVLELKRVLLRTIDSFYHQS
jgi:hypothetical protein